MYRKNPKQYAQKQYQCDLLMETSPHQPTLVPPPHPQPRNAKCTAALRSRLQSGSSSLKWGVVITASAHYQPHPLTASKPVCLNRTRFGLARTAEYIGQNCRALFRLARTAEYSRLARIAECFLGWLELQRTLGWPKLQRTLGWPELQSTLG
jgi:hypothetical protein